MQTHQSHHVQLRSVLESFFEKEAVENLYNHDAKHKLEIINSCTLEKYIDKENAKKILIGDTHFYDLNKKENDGKFEIAFSDKLATLILKEGRNKQTCFSYPDAFTLGSYQISFMTNQEYRDGVIFYIGEFTQDCESLGKSGGHYCLYDALAPTSRTFLIRRNNKIIGQSLVFCNDKRDVLVISSVACTADTNTKIIRLMVEALANKLLRLNQDVVNKVVIGIGGRNFISMNGVDFKRTNGEITPQYTALGKIRFTENLSSLTSAVKICEQSIGYPIMLDSNYTIRIEDERKYAMEAHNRKDCYRVATLVSKENISEKENSVAENIKLIRAQLTRHTNVNEEENVNGTKKRLGNIFTVMKYLSYLAEEKLNTEFSIEQVPYSNRNYVGFFIAPVANEQREAIFDEIAIMSNYNITRSSHQSSRLFTPKHIAQALPTSSIRLEARLDYFSNGKRGKERYWGDFCKRVEAIKMRIR